MLTGKVIYEVPDRFTTLRNKQPSPRTPTCTSIPSQELSEYMHARTYVWLCTNTRTITYMHTHTQLHTHTQSSTKAHTVTYAHCYTWTPTHAVTYTHAKITQTFTHTQLHIHTHTVTHARTQAQSHMHTPTHTLACTPRSLIHSQRPTTLDPKNLTQEVWIFIKKRL